MYLPYAKHMMSQDRFEDARLAYLEGGFPDLATKVCACRFVRRLARLDVGGEGCFFFRPEFVGPLSTRGLMSEHGGEGCLVPRAQIPERA